MHVAILLPCYNEEQRLERTVHRLEELARSWRSATLSVVVVDDGSTVPAALEPQGGVADVYLLRHPSNLGQGAALQTGVAFALRLVPSVDAFVTMDADGQHDPESVRTFCEHLDQHAMDIVFGNRFLAGRSEDMPRSRALILRAACVFERWVTGLKLGDAHNGFRVFNHSVATALDLKQDRMAHATEFKQLVAKHRFRYAELPTSIAYNTQVLAKGQSNLGSFYILKDLVKAYFFNG